MPIVPVKFSAHNEAGYNTTITATTQAAGYPASNMLSPASPFLEWRSTNLAIQQIQIDFGAPRLVELVVLVNVNFIAPGIMLHFESTPMFQEGPVIAATPGFNYSNRRYSYAWVPSPPGNRRYLRLEINTTSTTDSLAYFRCGGIWAGPLFALPRDIRWEEEMVTVEPMIEIQPAHHGWRQRLKMGEPYTIIRARRLAVTANGAAPGVNAELQTWQHADYLMWYFDAFAWFSNRGKAQDAWIMRRISEAAWPIHQTVSEGDLVMEELTGP
jgi:hypothetical protein